MHHGIRLHPAEELSPGCIMDTLGKLVVLDHVAYLKVFIGNQVVRRDERVRRFPSEIFTLPMHFQIAFRKGLSSFLAVFAPLVLARNEAMQAFEFLFGFAIMTRVVYGVAIRIRVEAFQSHINTDHVASSKVFNLALGLNGELAIVAIGPMDNAYALDLFDGKGCNLLFLVTHKPQPSDPAAIGEGDMLAIGVKLPSRLFVLNTPVIMLELGIALLPRLVVLAVVIETADSEPRPIRRCLTCLGIEQGGKGVLFGKLGTRDLQVILADGAFVHPLAQALVADELHDPDGLINGCILRFGSIKFVLIDQHCACLFFPISAILIIHQ